MDTGYFLQIPTPCAIKIEYRSQIELAATQQPALSPRLNRTKHRQTV